jgi:hypothetical protein
VSTAGFSNIYNPNTCGSFLGQPDGWGWFQGDGSTVDITYNTATNDPILHVITIVITPCSFFALDNVCINANGPGGDETINFATTAGTYYLIMVEDNLGNMGVVTTGCLSVSNGIPPVLGCTNSAAINYNPFANVDDGSCVFPPVDYLMPTSGINNEYVGACLVSDCGPSIFTDDGGFGGDYSLNINQIYRVFCPDAAGQCMSVTFNSFITETFWDYLVVKNGPTQNSPDIISLTGDLTSTTPFTYTSTDASGCLTFRFNSDFSITDEGWSATLQCVPCAGGPNGTDNNDCVNLTPLCSSATISNTSTGPGIEAEGCTGSNCPAGGENHTNWYYFKAFTSGTIDINILPNNPLDDYDYAIYGPNTTCANLGPPLNCSDAATTGFTGTTLVTPIEFIEDVTGDGLTQTITANAGDYYILVVDEWSPSGTGYDLNFGGSASLDCAPPLPVELSTFTAEYAPELGVVDLFWITESENNNDYFDVERSIDGFDFKKIGTVNGTGNTQQQTQYYAMDKDPITGVNYYRLKQVDFNGEFEYSDVVAVNILDDFYDLLSLFPNPTTGQTEVIFNSYTNENVLLSVMSSEGSTIVNTMIEATKGGNRFNLDISMKPRGVYIISITSRDKVYRAKLIKEQR